MSWANHKHVRGAVDTYEDDVLIGLAISGGGFRSAAFAYGAMKELDNLWLCRVKSSDRDKRSPLSIVKDKAKCEVSSRSLLDSVKVISAVSGGAVAAAYYHLYGKQQFFDRFQSDVLDKGHNIPTNLRSEIGISKYSGLLLVPDVLPFVPLGYFLEQKIKATINSKGLVPNKTVEKVLGNLFVEKDSQSVHGIGESSEYANKPVLLIHATDLTNSRLFTFDQEDLDCFAREPNDIRLSQKLAATTALPGLIEPLKLKNQSNPAAVRLKPCLQAYGDAVKNKEVDLADGGIYDNLGIDGLLRYFITLQKDRVMNKHPKVKAFIIVLNAAPPTGFSASPPDEAQNDSDEKLISPLVQQILHAFDVLTTQKDAVSRFMFDEALRYGVKIVELSLLDLLEEPNRTINKVQNNGTTDHSPLREIDFEVDKQSPALDQRATQLLARLANVLWFPTQEESRSLISAGRLVAGYKASTLSASLHELLERRFTPHCSELLHPRLESCWPEEWMERNPYDGSLEQLLKGMRRDVDHLALRQHELLGHGLTGANETLVNAMTKSQQGDEVYAVDYGQIDWGKHFGPYSKANQEAVERGVKIHRVFIIPPSLTQHERLESLVDAIFEQKAYRPANSNGSISVRIALKKALEKEIEKHDQIKGCWEGMALFQYKSRGNKDGGNQLLVEEVHPYAGEVGLNLYYAVRTYFSFNQPAKSNNSHEAKMYVGDKPRSQQDKDLESEQDKHLQSRAKFLEWLNSSEAKAVCSLEQFDRATLLDILKRGEDPCLPRHKAFP
jgi:predicted acylesterase/phospholipase RssA